MENYVCGTVTSLTELKKPLRSVLVDVGASSDPLTIVTNAQNVRMSSRVVVACVGAVVPVGAAEGEDGSITVGRQGVGGVMSEGMLCDSVMLGWSGGGEGVAVQVPDSFPPGSAPPAARPRMDGGGGGSQVPAAPEAEPLFEKKMTKEEKKAAAKAKREAKKKAKAEVEKGES